jgi:hypothetical protein
LEAKIGMPFVYSYLVLPLTLHTETRERLPRGVVTRLINWAERNPDIMTSFVRRFVDLRNASRAGLLLLTTSGLATIGAGGSILASDGKGVWASLESDASSADVKACMKKAAFLGRWLAVSGTPSTILTALGVRL